MKNESGHYDSYSFSNSFQIPIPSFQAPKIEFPNARQVRDFAVTTVSVGALVGGAAFGCAVVMNPVTVAMVGLPFYAAEITGVVATGSSSHAAKFVGEKLVRYGYKAAGQDLDEGAFNVGSQFGSFVGFGAGFLAAGRYEAAKKLEALHTRFLDLNEYAKHSRALTENTLENFSVSVKWFRANGFHIDHIIPVKWGWILGLSPELIAAPQNLHALPAVINLQKSWASSAAAQAIKTFGPWVTLGW